MMADPFAFWYAYAVKNQRHSMRGHWNSIVPKTTIAGAPTTAFPQPTTFSFFNAGKKIVEIGSRMLVFLKMRRHGIDSLFSVLFAILFLSGCARFHSEQIESQPDGSTRKTHVYVLTLFDAHSDLTKLRASTSDKTQLMSLAGLTESASSTNFVEILRLIATIAAATAK